MGWASGSSLMGVIIEEIEELDIDYDTKVDLYKILINAFEDRDCDTLMECLEDSPAFDEAYKSLYKEKYDEDYDEYFEDDDEF